MGDHDLVEIIEGALLAAGEPLSKKQLAQLFDELGGFDYLYENGFNKTFRCCNQSIQGIHFVKF